MKQHAQVMLRRSSCKVLGIINFDPIFGSDHSLGIENALGIALLANLKESGIIVTPVSRLPPRLFNVALVHKRTTRRGGLGQSGVDNVGNRISPSSLP